MKISITAFTLTAMATLAIAQPLNAQQSANTAKRELTASSHGWCGNGWTCAGADFGPCCSHDGKCGSGDDYCGTGCQSDYGSCGSDAE